VRDEEIEREREKEREKGRSETHRGRDTLTNKCHHFLSIRSKNGRH
jgi:hypothetical protein